MKNGPYELIIAPPAYPGKRYRNRYIYEHHYVWWKNKRQVIPRNYEIHHINGNKRDNSIHNLELIKSSLHKRKHSLERGIKTITLNCFYCGSQFPRALSQVKIGQTIFYCSRQHMGIVQGTINGKKFKEKRSEVP